MTVGRPKTLLLVYIAVVLTVSLVVQWAIFKGP